jgi:hypothetical protein
MVRNGDLDEEHLDCQVVHAEVAQPGDELERREVAVAVAVELRENRAGLHVHRWRRWVRRCLRLV